MGILKDWKEDNESYRLNRRIVYLLSPGVWFRLHKWRKQRANRGWSDRDTWGAGEHIAKMTAEMLQHLVNDSYVDWDYWFELNKKDSMGYKDLQSVINDINEYLDFQLTGWTDGLDVVSRDIKDYMHLQEDGHYEWKSPGWIDISTGKKLTEKQITARIKKWSNQEDKLYKKATNAMQFFGRNFASFWD